MGTLTLLLLASGLRVAGIGYVSEMRNANPWDTMLYLGYACRRRPRPWLRRYDAIILSATLV